MSQSKLIHNLRTQTLQQLGVPFWIMIALLIATIAMISVMNQESSDKMCRLFEDYEATSSEKHRILMALGSANLKDFDLENGQVCVPRIERATYLAAVRDQHALPRIFEEPEELKINPFLLKSQQKQQALDRKKQQVRNMILRLHFVREVMFEMDWIQSNTHYKPDQQSAVVMVSLKEQTALTRQQVATIQGIVSGAVAGIKSSEVVVTDANVGISYGDLKDPDQSELIELVTWQMARRKYYLDQLHDLTYEYPGLEINVEVRKQAGANHDSEQQEKIAAEIPTKLAIHSKTRSDRPQVTLNSGGAIEQANFDSNDVPFSGVSTASYLQPIKTTEPIRHEAYHAPRHPAEVVRIRIRVPIEVISNYELDNSIKCSSGVEKFEAVKRDIVSRVKQLLPDSVLPDSTPISVVMKDSHFGLVPPNRAQQLREWLRVYWPFGAIAMIGIIAVFWNRKIPAQDATIAVSNLPASSDDQLLQNQLSELIDTDPAAAANVIKNWIRSSN